MSGYLPPTEDGWLPFCVLLVGVTTFGNVIQCYSTLHYTQRIYSGSPSSKPSKSVAQTSPVTPLSARTFGTWNLAVGFVRLYAAYNLHEKSWYQMSMLTYVIGLFHFGSEAFLYKTCQPKGPWLAPISVASLGLLWHVVQYDNYVKQ